MAQIEILQYLKGKNWTTSKQMVDGIGITRGSINRALRVLTKTREVQRKEINKNRLEYIYKLK